MEVLSGGAHMVKLCLVRGMEKVIKDRGEERIGMTGKVGLFTNIRKVKNVGKRSVEEMPCLIVN